MPPHPAIGITRSKRYSILSSTSWCCRYLCARQRLRRSNSSSSSPRSRKRLDSVGGKPNR
eukprot:5742400-Amphidinium_carterae.1